MKPNYEELWKYLKKHYMDRIEKLEKEGKKDHHACMHARATVGLMKGLEYRNTIKD